MSSSWVESQQWVEASQQRVEASRRRIARRRSSHAAYTLVFCWDLRVSCICWDLRVLQHDHDCSSSSGMCKARARRRVERTSVSRARREELVRVKRGPHLWRSERARENALALTIERFPCAFFF
jgi:hypothetical protein